MDKGPGKMMGDLSDFEQEILNMFYQIILENKFEGAKKKAARRRL
jgi:hypothetical protein